MSQRIFIVEDEADMADMLSHHLRVAGYSVESAANGRVALEMIKVQLPDLIVLDLMLPELSGLDLCRALRGDQKTRHIAIIILSARSEEIDRVLGFELGADDYVVKPFSPREFALRIRAVLRRQFTREITDFMKVGDLVVDRSRHEVWAADNKIEVTATEFKLLSLLMERHGRVQNRDRLLSDVWGYDALINTRTVDTHMRRLRDKLGPFGDYIETVRGFGYRLSAPQE